MINDDFAQSKLLSDFADGFYVSTGTIVSLNASFAAKADVSVGPFSAGATGGVYTGNGTQAASIENPQPLTVSLSGGSDGKVRLNSFNSNSAPPFQAEGELDAGLDVFAKVGVTILGDFVGVEYDLNIATVQLLSFGSNSSLKSNAPVLATWVNQNTGELQLANLGPNETFIVGPDSDDPTGALGDVDVTAMGITEEFKGVKQIDATTSSGNNSITIEPGVRANASLTGGSGSDNLTYEGAGNATLTAGTGDDQLTFDGSAGDATLQGGSGTDTLIGATGNDLLTAGSGPTELHAGTGNDALEGGTGTDTFFWQVGDGAAAIQGGSPNSTLEVHGTPAAEQFTVSAAGSGVTIQVPAPSKSGSPLSLTATNIQQIDFEGGGGGDTFTINNLATTTVATVGINLSEAGHDAGGGDKIVINGDQQVANQVQIATVNAETGLSANNKPDPGVVTSVGITPVYTGGPDVEKFTVYAAIPDSSDALTVNTGSGNDTVMVQGTQPNVTAPKPGGHVFVNTGSGNNSITVGGPGNLDDIQGDLTVLGGAGTTSLTIDDQTGGNSSAQSSRGYTLGATGLTVAPVGQALPPPQISFSGLASLSLNLSNHPSQLDVEGTLESTTIQAGNDTTTVNLDPVSQDLDNLFNLLTVNGDGAGSVGGTTLNVYDQKNMHASTSGAANVYLFAGGVLTREVPQITNIHISNLAAINLWAAHSTNNIQIQEASESTTVTGQVFGVSALTVHAGTPNDQITVDLPTAENVLSAVTIDGDGASLTVGGSGIGNAWEPLSESGGYYATVLGNEVNLTVTAKAVTYSNSITDMSEAPKGADGKPVDPHNPSTPQNPGNPLPTPGTETITTTLSQVSTTINYSNLQSLVLQGAAVDSTYNVQSTTVGTPVTISGEEGNTYEASIVNGNLALDKESTSSNTFNVSPEVANLDTIQGGVHIEGGKGTNTLNIDDTSNTKATVYTLAGTEVSSNNSSAGTIDYWDVQGINLYGGSGKDIYNIESTPSGTALTVQGGNGGNTILVGQPKRLNVPPSINILFGYSLDSIQGPLTVNGGNGTTQMTMDDDYNFSSAHGYNLTASSLQRTGGIAVAPISFSRLTSLTVKESIFAADATTIESTASSTTTTVDAGNVNNTILVGQPYRLIVPPSINILLGYSLDSIQGPLTVNGGNGTTQMTIDDDFGPSSRTYKLNAASLQFNTSLPAIQFSKISTLVLDAAPHATVDVLGLASGTTAEINLSGIGSDIVNVQVGDDYGAGLTVHGQGKSEIVNVDDQTISDTATYAVTSTSVTRTTLTAVQNFAPEVFTLNYDGITSLAINGGPGPDTARNDFSDYHGFRGDDQMFR